MGALVITGGTLVDGTGAQARSADLLVEDGRIAAVAPGGALKDLEARERIDATDRVVCPGFVDPHSHGDLVLALEDEDLRRRLVAGRIAQGITTEIVGNCGLGPAPLHPGHVEDLRGILAWMTPRQADWPWRDVGSFLHHLQALGVPLNVGSLVAHGALRIEQAGLERALPSVGSLAAMTRSLERALDQGAFGMSLGLIYPPGSFTPSEEIAPLAGALARHDAVLTAHVRGSSETLLEAVEEILSFGREQGVRVHHSHNEAVGPAHWPKIARVLAMEDAARHEGVRATCDMFPYTAAATTMAAIYPPWALEGGIPALVERLRDPATRARIRRDVETIAPVWPPWEEDGWAHNLVRAVGWKRITVGAVATEAARFAEGLDLVALGRRSGLDPFEAVSDLMIQDDGRVSQVIHGISGDGDDDAGLVALMTHPRTAVCTDANDTGRGLPHPAAYGTYPRVLGHYVREKRVMSLEEAIRKMTSLPAETFGIRDRGVIRKGAWADIVIFDPAEIGSAATFRNPRRAASGIDAVLVNGVVVCEVGRLLPVSPGAVIRRPAAR